MRRGFVFEVVGREVRVLFFLVCFFRVWSWRGVYVIRGFLVVLVFLIIFGVGRGGLRVDGESLSIDLGKDSGG